MGQELHQVPAPILHSVSIAIFKTHDKKEGRTNGARQGGGCRWADAHQRRQRSPTPNLLLGILMFAINV